MRSKAASYLGFARRAGKIVLGVNAASAAKRCYLLVADSAIGKNSREKAESLKEKFACPLLFTENLGETVGRAGCMLAAVTDRGFAETVYGALTAENVSED